jgi:hypothetical protein
MEKHILRTIGAAFVAIAMVAAFTQVWVSAQEENGVQPSLVGSWDIQASIRDCATGDPIPGFPVIPALMTYHQGGTMNESDLGGPGIIRLEAHGVWNRVAGRQYSAAMRWLNFLPDRTPIGSHILRQSITVSMDGYSFTSTDTVEFVAPDGTVTPGPCATESGVRFH